MVRYTLAVVKTPSAWETLHEKSSEVIIPVLQHVKLHFGSICDSVRKIMIKIAISHGPHQGHKTLSALETHQEKSSEVIIPVLEHAKLTSGTGRDSVREIMIKTPICLIKTSLPGSLHRREWSADVDSLSAHLSYLFCIGLVSLRDIMIKHHFWSL